MPRVIRIGNRPVGPGQPVYIVAEMSANHNQSFDQAVNIIKAAKHAGADAIKLQTYTPDTLTIDCDNEYFKVGKGTIWEGRTLYDLYGEAYTPWEWQPKLQAIAQEIGLDFFSTPFDRSAVDFLENLDVPAYKIASFEIVDLPLIEFIAKAGKPIIMSTGMATLGEIEEAVQAIRGQGNNQIALLKCTSAYPAPPQEMNLRTLPHLSDTFELPVGLSDHTLGVAVAVTSIALGACIIEKHLTLSRADGGPDSAFSLEPQEFKAMVEAVHIAEKALGQIHYGISERETHSRVFRRSLFVVDDVKAGKAFTQSNVRSIRPGNGLPPNYLMEVLSYCASQDLVRGTPLQWCHLARGPHIPFESFEEQ